MIAVRPDAGLDQFAEGAVRGGVIIESDIPQIPGLLGVIVRLGEARRNEIRSQPTRGQPNGETLGLVTPEPAAFP